MKCPWIILVIILTTSLVSVSHAQQKYFVKLQNIDLFDKLDIEENKKYDSLSIINLLNNEVQKLRSDNYLLANIDSLVYRDSTCMATVFIGDRYVLKSLNYDEETELIVKSAGMFSLKYTTKRLDSTFVKKYLGDVLKYLVNNGYPFAEVGFEKVSIEGSEITADLSVKKNKFITYDTLESSFDTIISRNFMSRYLGIRPGQPYSHKNVLDIKKKILGAGFLKLRNDPYVSFYGNKALVRLPLEAAKANSFDFIIGVLPSNVGGQRKFSVNGQLSTDLLNRFGHGERITLDIRRLTAEDQLLSLNASYPYLAGLPIGVDGAFELRFNRGISIDLITNIGGQYITSGVNYIKAFTNYKSSNVVKVDTMRLITTKRLPANLDYKFSGGGLEIFRQNLDYRFNPRRGWSIKSQANVGIRSIVPNQGIQSIKRENIDFITAYDTLQLKSFQANLDVLASLFIPVKTFGTVKFSLNGGLKYNNGVVIENELFRIGGNKLLRGFDELSILSDYYAVFTSEFRLIIDQNSFLSFPFIDISRMRTYLEDVPIWDTAYGVGLGLNFATKAGIFNVSFAAGSRLNNPIEFNNTKVHFGYINLF